MCGAKSDVRFAPNSDGESGFPQTVMSALSPKADMRGATAHVCFGPQADMMKFSGDVATAGERGISLSARFLRHLRRSTGSDCKNHDCLPPRSVGILQTNDNGSPNGHHL
jgi:hypothetical protein